MATHFGRLAVAKSFIRQRQQQCSSADVVFILGTRYLYLRVLRLCMGEVCCKRTHHQKLCLLTTPHPRSHFHSTTDTFSLLRFQCKNAMRTQNLYICVCVACNTVFCVKCNCLWNSRKKPRFLRFCITNANGVAHFKPNCHVRQRGAIPPAFAFSSRQSTNCEYVRPTGGRR